MQNTAVVCNRTRSEIIKLLETSCRAKSIMLDNSQEDGQQHIVWTMPVSPQVNRTFRLPVRVQAVYQSLRQKRSPRGRGRVDTEKSDMTKAKMIAWRQALRWLQAQIAYMDTGQVTASEVFLPYMLTPAGSTVFDQFDASVNKQITAGDAQ